jgi:hypothetical protein
MKGLDSLNRDLDFSLKRSPAGGEPGPVRPGHHYILWYHLPRPLHIVVSPLGRPPETETETETERPRPVSLVSHSLLALLELFLRKCLQINTTHSILPILFGVIGSLPLLPPPPAPQSPAQAAQQYRDAVHQLGHAASVPLAVRL